MNDDETSRGSAWLLLFVVSQQQSVQGRDREGANILYAEMFDAIFPVVMAVARRAIPEICERDAPHVYAPYRNATQEFASRASGVCARSEHVIIAGSIIEVGHRQNDHDRPHERTYGLRADALAVVFFP